jgi:hypothetical protein
MKVVNNPISDDDIKSDLMWMQVGILGANGATSKAELKERKAYALGWLEKIKKDIEAI